MNFRHFMCLFFALIIPLNSSQAQEKQTLSLTKAMEIGLANSKNLHASRKKIEFAEAKSAESNSAGLPSVAFNAGYTRLSNVPSSSVTVFGNTFQLSPAIMNNYVLKLGAQQPIFTGNRISSSIELADLNSQASTQDFSKDKSEFVFNVKNAYWMLYKVGELKKLIDENVELTKAHLKDVQNLLAQGLATNNDVLKVQVQLSNAMYQQIEAKNNVQTAMVGLNNILGLPLITEIQLSDKAASNGNTAELTALIQQASENRSDIKALELRTKAGEAGITVAKSSWYPQISAFGNYYYNRPNQRIFPAADEFKDTWDLGISLSFNIWNWQTTKHQTTQAETQLAQTIDALGLLKDGIAVEVTQAYLTLKQSKDKIPVAKQGVEQAEENYRITKEKYAQGLALNTDMLDAEIAVLQAKTNLTQAITDIEIANARLSKSLGE